VLVKVKKKKKKKPLLFNLPSPRSIFFKKVRVEDTEEV